MIKIDNITKIYGKRENANHVLALDNLSVSINSGEFIGIIGESGSGKSTLLNLIGALDTPTNGSISINDIDITKFNEEESAKFRRANIGFVFQNFYLDSDFNVLKNVEVPLMLQGINKNDRSKMAKDILYSLDLQSKINSKISELSGGQLQRVCIARALVNNPKIILADEPTGNLDTKNGKMVIELLKNCSKKGITVILVTHNLVEAQYCDRLICLQDGKIVENNHELH